MAIDWRKSGLSTINIGEDMAPINWGAKCIFVKNHEKSGIFLENLENAPFLKKVIFFGQKCIWRLNLSAPYLYQY